MSKTSFTPADLDRLALRAQGGDHEAFVALVEATGHDLRVLVSCYATSLSMVDEVMQGTYVIAFEKLSTYEARGTLRSWLGGIARNLIRRELDGRRRVQALDGEVLDQALAQVAHERLEREDDAVPERELATLRRCLDELAPEDAWWRDGAPDEGSAMSDDKRGAGCHVTLSPECTDWSGMDLPCSPAIFPDLEVISRPVSTAVGPRRLRRRQTNRLVLNMAYGHASAPNGPSS